MDVEKWCLQLQSRWFTILRSTLPKCYVFLTMLSIIHTVYTTFLSGLLGTCLAQNVVQISSKIYNVVRNTKKLATFTCLPWLIGGSHVIFIARLFVYILGFQTETLNLPISIIFGHWTKGTRHWTIDTRHWTLTTDIG